MTDRIIRPAKISMLDLALAGQVAVASAKRTGRAEANLAFGVADRRAQRTAVVCTCR